MYPYRSFFLFLLCARLYYACIFLHEHEFCFHNYLSSLLQIWWLLLDLANVAIFYIMLGIFLWRIIKNNVLTRFHWITNKCWGKRLTGLQIKMLLRDGFWVKLVSILENLLHWSVELSTLICRKFGRKLNSINFLLILRKRFNSITDRF